jgi:hypothetical protein
MNDDSLFDVMDAADSGQEVVSGIEGTPDPAPETEPEKPEPPEQPAEEAASEQAGKKYRREIDLGDGSGVQVFEADTLEELTDKLVEAQAHATRKIRELNQRAKAKVAPDKKREARKPIQPRPLSEEEQFIVGQRFAEMPAKAFETLFESVTGMKPEEFRSRIEAVDAINEALSEQQAAEGFILDHVEDYHPSPKNSAAIMQFIEREGLAVTRQNLEYAYQELSSSGLLESAPAAKPAGDGQPSKPAAPAASPKKPVSTGLPARGGNRQPVVSDAPSVDELNRLPLEEARERISRALYAKRAAQGSR